MNLLDYIYHPLTPFVLMALVAILFTLWRVTVTDRDHWEASTRTWEHSSDQFEERYAEALSANDALRLEIVQLAKRAAPSPEPLDPGS